MRGPTARALVRPSQEDGRREENRSRTAITQLFASPATPGDRVSVPGPDASTRRNQGVFASGLGTLTRRATRAANSSDLGPQRSAILSSSTPPC